MIPQLPARIHVIGNVYVARFSGSLPGTAMTAGDGRHDDDRGDPQPPVGPRGLLGGDDDRFALSSIYHDTGEPAGR